MLTLYQFATSPFTEKVRRALNYKSLPFGVHEVERGRVAEGAYQHVSATGKFPALVVDDEAVWDSTDILYRLEAIDSGPSLIPDDPREAGIAHAIEEWADESLYFYEMTMRLSWAHNLESALDEFSRSLPAMPKPQLKEMILKSVGQLTQAQGVGRKPREQVVADVERHLARLNDLLHDRIWLAGDALSIADLAVISQLNALLYAEEARLALKSLGAADRVTPWMRRIDQLAPK
ncbi:MAG: glutathione S-transferase family protein [Pseudomonadota bacterium]